MHCDFFFINSFEDMGIYHVFQHSFDRGGVIPIHNRWIDKIREKYPYLKNYQKVDFWTLSNRHPLLGLQKCPKFGK